MRNPFRYGGVVGQDAFCNREQELSDLSRAMENGDRLFVLSERRMGKTSLVQLALEQLDRDGFITVYVDLWPTEGELTFATAMAKAISESVSNTADRLLKTAKQFFGRLAPSVTIDDAGNPQVKFELKSVDDAGPELEAVLDAPFRLSQQTHKKVVVVLDEFQQVSQYDSDRVERKLRSAIQTHEGVAYVFLGSRKHLVNRMFLDEARPLYRAGGHYPLGSISQEDWMPFIRERFEQADKLIPDNQIRAVCKLTEGHPFYTQHLCHAIWELCEPNSTVTDVLVNHAVELLLERESYAYATLWESLSLNQRRFLKGLAHEPPDVRPFSAGFIRDYRLGTASNVQRASEPLLERDVIDRDNGSYLISDRFFRIWIQQVATP